MILSKKMLTVLKGVLEIVVHWVLGFFLIGGMVYFLGPSLTVGVFIALFVGHWVIEVNRKV